MWTEPINMKFIHTNQIFFPLFSYEDFRMESYSSTAAQQSLVILEEIQ